MMSLHLKATMMKISDPVLFGHCVQVYYKVKLGFLHNFGPCLNAIASDIACFRVYTRQRILFVGLGVTTWFYWLTDELVHYTVKKGK